MLLLFSALRGDKLVDLLDKLIDIDAVRSTEAPGASASNPSGLKAPELAKIAYLAGRSIKVKYLDIMEVSPPLDEGYRSAALAASAIFSFFRGLCER